MPPASPPIIAQEPLIACHECDLLQREVHLPGGGAALCHRCGAMLFRSHPQGLDRALAFSLAAIVLYVISNAFPIVSLKVGGEVIQATLLGTIEALYRDDMLLVAGLILFTAILAPLLHLLSMIYLLLPLRFGRAPARPERVLRLLVEIRHWGMIEVFVLGILVSLVKLASLASVLPGIGLWSFAALMFVFTAASTAFDPRQVWAKLGELST